MGTLRLLIAWIVGALAIGASAQDLPLFSCESLPVYRQALDHLDSAVTDAASAKLWSSWVPDRCDFSHQGRHLAVDHAAVKQQLASIGSEEDADDAKAQLAELHQDLKRRIRRIDLYARPIDPTTSPKLSSILSRPEFRQVQRHDASATLKEQLLQLVIAWLSRILRDPSDALLFVHLLAWGLGAVALAILLPWLWRWLSQTSAAADSPRASMPFAPSAKPWRQWLAEARQAHDRGDYRGAIHLGYWAAISKLESAGKWPPDRARTPREYVALLPRNGALRSVLQGITSRFEIAWYGYQAPPLAESQQFLQTVEHL